MLLDEVPDTNGSQAFYMKFKPSEQFFEIMFSADGLAGLAMGDYNQPQLYIGGYDYVEDFEGNLQVQKDSWYHVLLAMGSDGLLQGMIWEDGNEGTSAFINLHIGQSFGDPAFEGQSWQVNLGYEGKEPFIIDNYAYYRFENFVMMDRILGSDGDNQNNFEEINLDDPNSISSIFLNDMQFMTGGTPDGDMQEDFSYVAIKNKSDDGSYVEFGSDGEGANFTRGESLYYDSRNNNQAVLFRFMPNDTEDLTFTIVNENEISMKFIDGMPYHVDMKNSSETPYSEFGPANITLEEDKWYWALMAVDGSGTYRSAVWKEEDPMTGANCQDDTGVADGARDWNISFGANQTFILGEYIVFDFDSINDGTNNDGNDTNESNEDLGPYWEINIGGDFNIMSDMVWQECEPQDFKIGSVFDC